MSQLLHFGEIVAMNAYLSPDKVGARDLTRSLTFRGWNDRSCKLANALVGLGLEKGDRIAVLAYNCLEWMEIYAAVAKAGLVVVPINFRLVGSEVRYIVENSEAKAVIVQDDLLDGVETIRAERLIAEDMYVHFGGRTPPGYRSYEDLVAAGARSEPSIETGPDDPYALLYTSGTTGKPKGAIRTSGSLVLLAYLVQVDWGFSKNDLGLLVMPMCHANSLFFAHIFAACGAAACIYDQKSFEPEQLLRTLAGDKFTFTSLVPTHYIMMLGLPESVKRKLNVESVTKLLISSAPARQDTKLALMEYFRRSQLYEAYGSTEAGWVTLLRPEEQLTKLGSIGRECLGTGRIKLLDAEGNEIVDGEVGELYSRTPYAFQGYWKLPEKTAEAFRGRRHGPSQPGRLLLPRRPQEQYDHQRRGECLSIGSGAGCWRSSQSQRCGCNWHSSREVGRGGSCSGRFASRSGRIGVRYSRLVQRQDRRIQTTKIDLVHC